MTPAITLDAKAIYDGPLIIAGAPMMSVAPYRGDRVLE
jgi:hypothetical protein